VTGIRRTAMAIVTTKLTAEEFFELPEPPDGSKQELVKGEVVTMSAPGIEHGRLQTNVAAILWSFLRGKKLGTVLTESGIVTEHDEDADTVRGPDVSYYSKERLPLDRRVVKYNELPPDLCVEIVSPTNTRKELREKIKEYFDAGVRMVWIVEPEHRSVAVYSTPDQQRLLPDTAELSGGDVLPGFTCRVAEIFE
jgi:Uma2 family endonuclease